RCAAGAHAVGARQADWRLAPRSLSAVSQALERATIPSPGIASRRAVVHALLMSRLSSALIVEAPADAVWEVVGRGFHRIGEWASAIPASTAIPAAAGSGASSSAAAQVQNAPATLAAPVAGRVCQLGVPLLAQVEETLIAYDEANRTLTYDASGMPAFSTPARSAWPVVQIDRRRSLIKIDAQSDTRGLLGHIALGAILAQLGRTSRYLADDLRHFVEHGTPSPRKLQQLLRRSRQRSQERLVGG